MSAADFGIKPGSAAPFFTKVDNTPLATFKTPNDSLSDHEQLMFLKNICGELIRKGIIEMASEIQPEGVLVEAYLCE